MVGFSEGEAHLRGQRGKARLPRSLTLARNDKGERQRGKARLPRSLTLARNDKGEGQRGKARLPRSLTLARNDKGEGQRFRLGGRNDKGRNRNVHNKHSVKKKVAALLLLAALLALVVAGTYAWKDYSQHKTNELSDKAKKHDVALIEDFQEKKDWKVGDGPLTKKIAVKNTGSTATTGTTSGYEQVYVRIQLKEYMDMTPLKLVQTNDRYMINTSGDLIVFATQAEAEAAYPGHTVTYLTDAVSRTSGYFVATQAGDPNGQYGKQVITEYDYGAKQFIVGDASLENARLDAAA